MSPAKAIVTSEESGPAEAVWSGFAIECGGEFARSGKELASLVQPATIRTVDATAPTESRWHVRIALVGDRTVVTPSRTPF